MKIIVLGTRGFPDVQGGIEKHCQDIYPRLVDMGCQVTVLARAPYVGNEPYTYKGVNIEPLFSPKQKYLEAIAHTFLGVFKARLMNPDILHIHAIGPSLFVPLARLLGMKVVITHHGPDYERKKWNGFAKWILRLGEKWGVTYANHVIVISKGIAQTVREEFGREPTVIPNGVHVHDYVPNNGTLDKFDIRPGKYILAVGRFVPEKGFNDLVESYRRVAFARPVRSREMKLVIVGDADHEDDFSRGLKRTSRDVPDVVLTGYQTGDALKELYSNAAHFVLPSFHEGLPIVLLEALSYGLSCLVSDIPANREVKLEEDRYFKPGDHEGMARKLSQYMDLSSTQEERLTRIEHVKKKYNWTRIADKTLQVYEYAQMYGGLSIVSYQPKPVLSWGRLAS